MNATTQQALEFYANPDNWKSSSKGFALQYDTEPSAVDLDRGAKAKEAIEAAEKPIGYLAHRNGEPSWDEDCVCKDAVYPVDEFDDRVSVAIYTHRAQSQPPQGKGLFIDMIAEHSGLAEELRALDVPAQPTEQLDAEKIGCVNHDCNKCKAEQPSNSTSQIDAIKSLIENDAFAMSFQTIGQYRTALLKARKGQA
jgi:hypothetical protein